MPTTATIKIVVRRGTLAQWTSANPILLSGEIGYVTDGGYFIVGNGTNTFTQLSPAQPIVSDNRYRSERYIVQDLLNPLSNALNTAITNEATARSSADVTLQLNIDNEALARGNADSNLQSQISAEVTARTTADTNLNNYISTVETNLSSSIVTLETNIQTWYGLATTKGDILVYDNLLGTFNILSVGNNGDILTADSTEPLGVKWEAPPTIPVLGDMTTAVYDPDLDGIVESAEREQIAVINKTGATLTKGTIVYIKSSSSSANYPEVLKASATTELTSSKTIGAVYEDIANNDTGYIVTSGQVHNLNTSAYTVGTKLWLSTTAGEVTTTPPTPPFHTVFIGFVTRSQNNNGRILYAIQNGYELDELHNVLLSNVVDFDVLTYIGGLWVNNTIVNVLGYTPADEATVNTALANKEDLIAPSLASNYWRGDKTWQPLDKSAVGLNNVDNTSDANKPISTATQTALNGKENSITAGTTAQYWRGDKTWQTLNKNAVGLGNVDNTSDANKPISTATQTALNGKENSITAGTTAQYYRGDKTFQTLDKSAVGLDQVDNTSDADKPVSTAVQTELDNRVPYTGAISNVELGGVQIINSDAIQGESVIDANYVSVKDLASTSIVEIKYDKLKFTDNVPITPTTTEYSSTGIKFADGTTQTTKAQEIITLTTTGTSGSATFIGNTLNIPVYSSGGGGISASESIAYAIALG